MEDDIQDMLYYAALEKYESLIATRSHTYRRLDFDPDVEL